jgi:DtxR family Mn-dependent transcriptional regulator
MNEQGEHFPHGRRWRHQRGASPLDQEDRVDELLELIWNLREKGIQEIDRLLAETKDQDARFVLSQMMKEGLYEMEGNTLRLKEKGEERARDLIRRHRLTERLLMEIFELSEEEAETEACRMEHSLSPAVTDSVCAFLGHPPLCPHGKPIPRGLCCARFTREVKPLVRPLSDLGLGEKARIVFISPRSRGHLEQLVALGVIPGSEVRLRQKNPAYVIDLGETTIALDEDLVQNIYVKPL